MIDALISSKTRIKLLLKFFLNSNTRAYLRSLEGEFGESSNAIRIELNRLEKAGLLLSSSNGNKKMFQANTSHPLYDEIHSIILKHIGLDRVIDDVVKRLGDVRQVYLGGDFCRGLDSPIVDLILVGDCDRAYLLHLIEKAEKLIKRKIRYLIYDSTEANEFNVKHHTPEPLLLWTNTL
jgi:hypothetical protein